MRATTIPFVVIALCASVAFGQTPAAQSLDRVFYFNHTETAQGMQEISTLIGGIGDMQQVSTDTTILRSVTVHGTAAQIGLAAWLFSELDQPAGRPPVAQQSQALVMHEYRMPGGSDDVVRVIYPTYAATLQEFQEVATVVRSVAQIRRVFTYNAPRALALRGTAEQAALAEWLCNELNRASQEQSASHEYLIPGGDIRENVVHVFYLTNVGTVQEFQEIATLVRSIGDIRYTFTYNTPKAVALRGTAEQMALAGWLFNELDKPANWTPAQDSATHEYLMSGSNEGVVHVYYLIDIATVQRFQQIVMSVRAATNIRRAFTYNTPRAVAFRGTAEQIALAGRLIKEQDKP